MSKKWLISWPLVVELKRANEVFTFENTKGRKSRRSKRIGRYRKKTRKMTKQ